MMKIPETKDMIRNRQTLHYVKIAAQNDIDALKKLYHGIITKQAERNSYKVEASSRGISLIEDNDKRFLSQNYTTEVPNLARKSTLFKFSLLKNEDEQRILDEESSEDEDTITVET